MSSPPLSPLRVLLVGAGNMGRSHGSAYHAMDGFELCGIVTRGESGAHLAAELGGVAHYRQFDTALAATKPDVVAIASFTETHVPYATEALNAGCHVFVEKPLASNLDDAQALIDLARERSRVLAVGYILRHHPSWQTFIELARTLGKPLVMRMNLNQQSQGPEWATHKALMATTSPLVDCGVHYVDVMTQMTKARATSVHAIGARLTDDLPPGMYNYGQLQVRFDDGSVGWYEAGWGPMMSEAAFFIKDVVGPKGAITIESGLEAAGSDSSNVDDHTATNAIRRHHGEVDADGALIKADEMIHSADEPDHELLCRREQEWFLKAIHGLDGVTHEDVSQHLEDVVESLKIVLAADQSIQSNRVVEL